MANIVRCCVIAAIMIGQHKDSTSILKATLWTQNTILFYPFHEKRALIPSAINVASLSGCASVPLKSDSQCSKIIVYPMRDAVFGNVEKLWQNVHQGWARDFWLIEQSSNFPHDSVWLLDLSSAIPPDGIWLLKQSSNIPNTKRAITHSKWSRP